jgi:hypothetical protein
VHPEAEVASGSVSISPSATTAEAGLGFNSKMVTMRPEVPIGSGSSQPMKRAWVKVTVRLLNTLGVKINNDQLPFRTTSDLFGNPPSLFSGDKEYTNLGIDAGQITIEQTQPLPSTVLLLTGTLQVHEQ